MVKAELVKQLLQQSLTALYASLFIAAIIFLGLHEHTALIPLLVWYTTITLLTIARIILINHLKKKLATQNDEKSIDRYAAYYSIGSLVNGISWGSLIFLYSPTQATIIQLFILVIIFSMPMASVSTTAILPSAFYAFTVPLLSALIIWPLFLAPNIELQFLLLALVYSIFVLSTGRQFHRNLYLSIQRGFENQHLVKELRKGNAKLQQLAYIDHLTNMPNRRQFQLNAERTLAKVKKTGSSMALMLIDVDNFKHINDSHGHEAGDELLKELSHKIKDSIRQNDMVTHPGAAAARLGGDEFIVLLECEHKDIDVEPAARRILHNIHTATIPGEIDLIPSVSIGIACAPKHTDDLRTLMSYADKAMYETKQNGGNGFTVYGDQEGFVETMILEAEIA